MCSSICKCIGCKNFEESPERKTLMHLADAAEVRVQQQTAAKTKLSSQISDLLMRTTPVISSGGGRYRNNLPVQPQPFTEGGEINSMFYYNTSSCSVLSPQVALYVCNKGGAGGDMWVSAGTGQKSRTDSPASGRSGEDDPGGVRTLPHEDNQFCWESQSRLCLHQLLG